MKAVSVENVADPQVPRSHPFPAADPHVASPSVRLSVGRTSVSLVHERLACACDGSMSVELM